MKKIIIASLSLLLFLAGGHVASAQFRIEGGWHRSLLRETVDRTEINTVGDGAYAGLGADLWLPVHGLSMDLGFYCDWARYRTEGSALLSDVMYGRMPLQLKYTYHFDDFTSVFAAAGPAILYAFYGKSRMTADDGPHTYDYFTDNDRRFDLQAGCQVGALLLGCLSLRLGYGYGILDQAADNGRHSIKRNALYGSLAFEF